MNPRIEKVIANNDYTLTLFFTNGEIKKYDISPFLDQGVFKKLKDINIFKQVKVSYGSVSWEDSIDICPDTLFLDSIKIED